MAYQHPVTAQLNSMENPAAGEGFGVMRGLSLALLLSLVIWAILISAFFAIA